MYSKKDFDRCLFNPMVDDVFAAYPQLSKIKSISNSIDDRMMKYIICVYDYRSPIVINNRELKIRKQVAAELCGYNLQQDDLRYLFGIETDYVLQAVDTFLKSFIHSRLWYMICCNENIFWEYGQRMLMPVSNNDESGKPMTEKAITETMALKTKLSDDMQSIDERLDAAYKRLYGNEPIEKFLTGGTTPERIAIERASYHVQ